MNPDKLSYWAKELVTAAENAPQAPCKMCGKRRKVRVIANDDRWTGPYIPVGKGTVWIQYEDCCVDDSPRPMTPRYIARLWATHYYEGGSSDA